MTLSLTHTKKYKHRAETVALGELIVPTLSKDPERAAWEERYKNYDEAHLPYDR